MMDTYQEIAICISTLGYHQEIAICLVEVDVSLHLGLVRKVARWYTREIPIEDTEEYGWGIDGLMRAQKKFDLSRGYKFSTYATWMIRGYIRHGLKVRARIRLAINPNGIETRLTRIDYNNNNCLSDFHTDCRRELRSWQREQICMFIKDGLDNYPIRSEADVVDKQILIDYYLQGMELAEIGKKIGLHKERIRQRKLRALNEMRIRFERVRSHAAA